MLKVIFPLICGWLIMVGDARARLPLRDLPIEVEVRPAICFSPCMVEVQLVIPPKLENRHAIVEVDGPEFRSSYLQLNGMDAPKRHKMTYTGLTTGQYDVKGVLYDIHGETARRSATLIVKGNQ